MDNRKGATCPWTCSIVLRFIDHICPRTRGRTADLQTIDSESIPQEFHLRVGLTRPPSLVATARNAKHCGQICFAYLRIQCCTLLQRSTFDWTGCCLSAACHGVIRAVLPHYLFQKEQAAYPFRGQQAESICSWIMKFSRNTEATKNAPHFPWRKARGLHTLNF